MSLRNKIWSEIDDIIFWEHILPETNIPVRNKVWENIHILFKMNNILQEEWLIEILLL
jgi:hypothetical protein